MKIIIYSFVAILLVSCKTSSKPTSDVTKQTEARSKTNFHHKQAKDIIDKNHANRDANKEHAEDIRQEKNENILKTTEKKNNKAKTKKARFHFY